MTQKDPAPPDVAASPLADTAETVTHPGASAPRWAKLLLLPAVVAMILSLDQGSKLMAQQKLAASQMVTAQDGSQQKNWFPTRTVTVIPGLFNFRYVENPAAAFSLTSGMPEWVRKPFLVGVSILAMVLILSWYWRTREPDWLILTAFALILGGALGNLVDRIAYGYVIDFVDWHLSVFNPSWPHWPTFNIADSAICLGAGGVLWRTFKPFVAQAVEKPVAHWPATDGGGLVEGAGPPAAAENSADHDTLQRSTPG